jgi:hypothetical protein
MNLGDYVLAAWALFGVYILFCRVSVKQRYPCHEGGG